MSLNLFVAFIFVAMGGIYFYRAYSGGPSMGLVSIATSDPVAISKKQRIIRSLLGLCFLGMGVSHLISYLKIGY
jgi:hypothetical protein